MNEIFQKFTGMTLLDPWMLCLALLIPVALFIRRWRGKPSVRFAPGIFTRDLPASWRTRILWLPTFCICLALASTVFALARPVHRDRLPLETHGIDILLCLDISSSMSAKDLEREKNRLEVAKTAGAQFISDRPNDRIGLLCFARYPDLRCPLTLDHVALKKFLSDVSLVERNGPEDATGIGGAVARSAQLLKGSNAKSKVIILLTDGEENVASAANPDEIAPVHAAQLCKELGYRVYTIAAGLGSQTPFGWIKLDTTEVRNLAEKTGGKFFEVKDSNALAGVYSQINDLEKVELTEPRYKVEEKFLPFLIAALILFLLGRLLDSTVLGVLP